MKKPNIVFILSDDHGQWALGAYGNKEVKTPHIDKLAKQGILFENFYCTSPVCSPARASILTGKMPSQHGVHDWIGNGCVQKSSYEDILVSKKRYVASLGDKADEDYRSIDPLQTVPYKEISQYKFVSHETGSPIEYMRYDTSYTEILSESGYECGLVGKWHLGASATPQKGYDFWYAIGKGGCLYHLPDFYNDGKLEVRDEYISDIITDTSIQFIDECLQKNKPFYVNLNFTAPHSPWIKEDQKEEIWELYDDCPFDSVPYEGIHPYQVPGRHPGYSEQEGRRYMLQGYYSAITAMDENIGRLIKYLEEKNILDNTIIIFTSDNGMNLGQHGVWGKGNGTFPMNFYDSSIKVPTIISQRNNPAIQNGVNQDMLSHYDFFPTILDLCGIDYPLDASYPGKSFVPLMQQGNLGERKTLVVFDEYGPNRMIRNERFKLIHRYPYGESELYDLEKDSKESTNLIHDENYKDVVVDLEETLATWFFTYVNPEVDGISLGVNGNGQFGETGVRSKGKNPFKPFPIQLK